MTAAWSFYGRVSTQHEQQKDALSNQMQWYDDQLKYHANWQLVGRYIDEGITGTLAKSVHLLCECWTMPETENST